MDHLLRLHLTLQPNINRHLPLRVIYHYLHISARSPLIPRDRFLNLTMDNTIHTMTPNDTHDSYTRLHYIHLFLDPPTSFPYILYTFDGQPTANPPLSAQRLTITTSLPSSTPSTKRPRRHRMMRTTSHTPLLGETITFPANSVQHQMTILTLVTHMLLSTPTLNTRLVSWGPVRHPNAHLQTLGIILATLALKRYHPIWFTAGPPLLPAGPVANMPSTPRTPLIPNPILGIVSTCPAPAAQANTRKRKYQVHAPTADDDAEDPGLL